MGLPPWGMPPGMPAGGAGRRAALRGLGWSLPLLAAACSGSRSTGPTARAVPGETGSGWSCVPYARSRSGIGLAGDAWQWWEAASGHYGRGRAPRLGAVLVLMRTSRLPQGHVAVVSRVVSPREIRVDHANWASGAAKGRVARDQPVQDISSGNDWSLVRIWYPRVNNWGSSNWPAYGFVYPGTAVAALSG